MLGLTASRGCVQLGNVGPFRPLQVWWAACRLLIWSLPPAEAATRWSATQGSLAGRPSPHKAQCVAVAPTGEVEAGHGGSCPMFDVTAASVAVE